jgi:D-alanyl-D-alanine carboxypeptidase (penicillin-binding protein 5/6)
MVLAAPIYPTITAKSAIVIEASTGKIIYEKNAQQIRYPASTTKIMTLITALEQGGLGEVVTASSNAANTEGSSIYLEDGERLKLLDLLYGIMLISGNDATVAVAEHISGSTAKFAKLMTDKAHAIGAINTNFTNPNGLPDPNHYTTAQDLALITAYGYKNPLFRQIVGTQHKIIPGNNNDYDRDLYNENKLLWMYNGANGVKTGYTEAAGPCLVSSATRGNVQLIAVILDAEQIWNDSKALLDFGFSKLRPVELVKQGEVLKTSRVKAGKSDIVQLAAVSDFLVPVSDGDLDQFEVVVDAPNRLDAPVAVGQTVGIARVLYKKSEIGTIDLVATEDIERKTFLEGVLGFALSVVNFLGHGFS